MRHGQLSRMANSRFSLREGIYLCSDGDNHGLEDVVAYFIYVVLQCVNHAAGVKQCRQLLKFQVTAKNN